MTRFVGIFLNIMTYHLMRKKTHFVVVRCQKHATKDEWVQGIECAIWTHWGGKREIPDKLRN